VENFSLADGSVVENAYAAVMPGETTIQVKTQWIERFVLSGQIGNLINVIEHEATHVKQNVHAPGVTDSANDEDVREFEAYCREIQVTIQRCAHDAEGHLQTRVQFEKAVTAARKHRKRAQERHVLVSRHATQWEHIEAALPATRAGLDKADAARAVYARDDAEVRDLLAQHHKKYIELGTLYDGADGIRRADELTAEADGLHILQAFARLPADATAAYRGSYEPEANAFLEFRKHRRLPRRPAARTEPTAAASSSLLAPPPGKSSLLAPPPSSKSSLVAPPPSASPRSSSTLSSPPVSVSKPSAAKDKDGDESDEEWGAYTSAPSDLSASSAAAAPAPKPPTPPTSGTPASKPPTTPTTSPGADDDWQPFQ
jgi:hypothetical protein